MSVLKREKAKPCVLTWKESLREANPLETLSLWLVEDIERRSKQKVEIKMEMCAIIVWTMICCFWECLCFFFLTAAAISWHSWSSFFVSFYFLADVFSLVFFSLAMQQKSSFFCKFFLVKETRPPFLKKEPLKYRARLVLWTLLLLQYFIQVFQLSRFPFLSVFDLVINQ